MIMQKERQEIIEYGKLLVSKGLLKEPVEI